MAKQGLLMVNLCGTLYDMAGKSPTILIAEVGDVTISRKVGCCPFSSP
eukprot:CAMPEP_0197719098 /NCGR_PEP_ID=MMETSP1434-20131217/2990_1 /TAXON_ID=265543 /ORGANISM="Minutocellus polymorphus, Strain CCMP3303" /LENGTH=47 /DNA_ID= /DNA_START= /DNA_END= /DNA_ORIENTATION=